jgi:phosphoglycolate phosphatase-like HAD superfamily hydrolase
MKLLLFDIDGTLLHVDGGVHRAVAYAIRTVTGRTVSTEGVTFAGRTDPAIFADVLRVSGVDNPAPVLDEVIRTYAERAQDTISPGDVELLPGVQSLLTALARRKDVCLGLVTGNVEPIAYHKLRSGGLAAHFGAGGAFGSDHADRNELPAMAVRRASSHVGHAFSAEQTIVIGDTKHDIRCARAAGTRVAAVCTGGHPRDALQAHTPDLLFDTLQDPDAVIGQLLDI